uniref:Uncharacterized protein n=1 Tax=Timema monikensis TaxID=170555 RepID=A0A7R9EBT9_9NEOP|nr:unnamed protein product [Timema monikensis]
MCGEGAAGVAGHPRRLAGVRGFGTRIWMSVCMTGMGLPHAPNIVWWSRIYQAESVGRVTRLPNNLSQAEPRALWTKRNLTDPLRPMGQPKLLAPYGVACPVPCGWTMNWAWSVVPFVCP